jgi:transmembrane sensor
MLNTDTALNVVFSPQEREVYLLKGEAAFSVAPDSMRSFTVRSQDTATTALGTKFLVQTQSDSVTVTVSEHAVQVSSPDSTTSSPIVIREGQQISHLTDGGWGAAQSVDANQASAWQRGKMIFQAQPLGAVVADLNRYRHGHIFILNPSLRSLPVTGVFEINDPDAALRVIEQTLGIRDTTLSPYFLFLH